MKHLSILLFLSLLLFSCGKKGSQDPLFSPEKPEKDKTTPTTRFEQLSPERTGITFVQDITESFTYSFIQDPSVYNGGGVAVIDIDNDGLQDLYFTSRQKECKLYRNLGGLKFEDVTAKAGVAAVSGLKTGVAVVDINADGFQDLYVCRTGLRPNPDRMNLLYVNNGNGTFTEKGQEYGIADISPSQCANFLDYDLDGDLDLYVVNQPVDFTNINNLDFRIAPGKTVRTQSPQLEHDTDRFFRNEGDGHFTDQSQQAGVWNRAWGLSVTATDFNADGYPDLYVGNDFVMPDFVMVNNQKGGFVDQGEQYFRHTSNHTMGVDIADMNNDCLPDLVSVDMLAEPWKRRKKLVSTMMNDRYKIMASKGYGYQLMRNTMQVNNGNGTFSEVGCLAGMFATDWSWAPLIADFDNDGRKDLFISNGIKRDLNDLDFLFYTADSINRTGGINPRRFKTFEDFIGKMPAGKVHNYMYQNTGSWRFKDVSESWGFGEARFSNGAVYADLDNDGDLDLVANAVATPATVYENKAAQTNGNHWLQIKCKGPAGNAAGTGAKIRVQAGGQLLYMEISPYRGFYSSVEPVFQVGLGAQQNAEVVEIEWPGGKYQRLDNVKGNQRLVLNITDAAPGRLPALPLQSEALFVESAAPDFRHVENEFEDFDLEKLLPHRLSRQGPCLASGDANADGLEDLFVGGAIGQAGAVYLQNKAGGFTRSAQPALEPDKHFEDTGAIWFDADSDGDADLLVTSGGNEAPKNLPDYTPRLYRNDGKGKLTRDEKALPDVRTSASAVAVLDYDGDNDPDLVLAGRVTPGFYPTAPESYLLQNDKGVFTDVTATAAPALKNIGMVSAVKCADLDGDKRAEIVLTGEWMPVSVLKWNGSQFASATEQFGLQNSSGWWNCLETADLDGDGDLDFVAGNVGLNTRYKATQGAPMRIFAKDWDGNGAIDPLLAIAEDGEYLTTIMRDYWVLQIGAGNVKKKFPRHTKYANATITDMYPPEVLKSGINLDAKMLQSAWFENKNGKFTTHDLPADAQVAPMHSILVHDFDGDGRQDVFLFGNDAGLEVETGRQDASNGQLFLNDGKGGFRFLPNRFHGLWAPGEVRTAILTRSGILVTANNSAGMQAWKLRTPQVQ